MPIIPASTRPRFKFTVLGYDLLVYFVDHVYVVRVIELNWTYPQLFSLDVTPDNFVAVLLTIEDKRECLSDADLLDAVLCE